jgi:hypothetical protein
MPEEPPSKPSSHSSIELKDAIASAWILLAGLLPGKLLPLTVGAFAPFVGRGLAWFVQEQAQEWVADRKASAVTRRAERYLGQMEKKAKKLPPNSPARLQLDQQIAQLADTIHQHRMNELAIVGGAKKQEMEKPSE